MRTLVRYDKTLVPRETIIKTAEYTPRVRRA